jgi:hypothetical protein
LRIKNAKSASSSSLITAPEGGVLNERRCKKGGAKTNPILFYKKRTKPKPHFKKVSAKQEPKIKMV